MKKSIERKTLGPLMKGYSTATTRAKSINDAEHSEENVRDETLLEIQRRQSSPKPAPKAEERNPQHRYTVADSNQRYEKQVNSGVEEILANSAQKAKSVSQFKRTKSADPFAARKRSSSIASNGSGGAGDDKKKEPTYVQKLLGLNRTTSNSSSKYASNIPSW